MTARQRILTIRLMEKAKANPAYADRLGIVIRIDPRMKGERYGADQKS